MLKKATKSTLLLAGSAVMMTALFSACSKSSSSLPAIGGYNSSNDVASANLKAHWSFEGTMNEGVSGTAPTSATGITYTTGINGSSKAANFTAGWALYPTIAAMDNMQSFTVSSWVKVANNGATNNQVSCFFALTAGTSQADWNAGPLEMYAETNKAATRGDTIDLHAAFGSYAAGSYSIHGDNINDYGVIGTDYQPVIGGSSKWIHYVVTYNATDSSRIKIYANGALVSNKNFEVRTLSGVPIGNLVWQPGTRALLGSFANSNVGFTSSAAQSWQGLFTGVMDELRVYNKPLSATDVSALYQLELAGR